MPAGGAEPGASYNPTVGLLYIFNLIVGTGALALPKAFQSAGWALSVVVLLISCLVSYVSATFVIESLSVANALTAKKKRSQQENMDYDDVVVSEGGPSAFEITERVEISQMASLFLGKVGVIFSYFALNVYLFGDLAIYSTTVPKSMMNIICHSVNATANVSQLTDPCHEDWPKFFDRYTVYRLCVVTFIAVCTPMVVAGITKTKYIQLATTVSRWTAFTLMIVLASCSLWDKGAEGHPPAANVHGFGSLFGVTVYAFMCHHSLPGLITPMSSKSGLFQRLSLVYAVVMTFYFTLSITGAFAFSHVLDVYTLNFLHDDYTSVFYFFCDHFLALFPIFTLTTNYPIVAITLINNIKVLKRMVWPGGLTTEEESLLENEEESEEDVRPRSRSRTGGTTTKITELIIPALTIGLPTLISLFTDNVLLLASVTGSYPGVGVQFVIPCWLVLRARELAKTQLNFPVPKKNASPFQSRAWPLAIFGWACFSILMVTLNIFGFSF